MLVGSELVDFVGEGEGEGEVGGVKERARVLCCALCSWARYFTLIVPLSTQVYKWVPANLLLGVTLRWTSIPSRGD